MAKKTSNNRIEQLLEMNTVKNNANLKAAAERHQAIKAEKEIQRLTGQMATADKVVDCAVDTLRELRSQADIAKAVVKKLDDARNEFLKDGNFDKFKTVCQEVMGDKLTKILVITH